MKKIIALVILAFALACGGAVTTLHSELAQACESQSC
jgi:hypothetical protein